jgi:hypothetical protein
VEGKTDSDRTRSRNGQKDQIEMVRTRPVRSSKENRAEGNTVRKLRQFTDHRDDRSSLKDAARVRIDVGQVERELMTERMVG